MMRTSVKITGVVLVTFMALAGTGIDLFVRHASTH
jgi:hypothetical protein